MITTFRTLIIAALLSWSASAARAQKLPMPPLTNSPVELFRMLMETNADGRAQFLAGKSPQARRIIETKLQEYGGMKEDQRNARLRSLQLRWHTLRLMKLEPSERTAQLASIPAGDRAVVEQRLEFWNILPPSIKQQVLSNDSASVQLACIDPTNFGVHASRSDEERGVESQRQQVLDRCERFFELSGEAQRKMLSKLTEEDRRQMEKTLAPFGKLSAAERKEAVEGFKKFSELSAVERAAFLQTAQRWHAMSEADRKLWRKIVTTLQSQRAAPELPHPKDAAIGVRRPSVAKTN